MKADKDKIVVVGVVEKKGMVLVGKKVIEEMDPLSGAWHIPGGGVENGETNEEALKREMMEETGLKIKINGFLDEYRIASHHYLLRWYLCSPLPGNPKAGSDLSEVEYVPKSEVVKICDEKTTKYWSQKILDYFS